MQTLRKKGPRYLSSLYFWNFSLFFRTWTSDHSAWKILRTLALVQFQNQCVYRRIKLEWYTLYNVWKGVQINMSQSFWNSLNLNLNFRKKSEPLFERTQGGSQLVFWSRGMFEIAPCEMSCIMIVKVAIIAR